MRLTVLALFSLLSLAPAQTQWSVGPGGFANLDLAYAAAQPGDIILVQQSTTFSALIGKGVRILAAGGDQLTFSFAAGPAQIANIPAGQTLVLDGFTLLATSTQTTNSTDMLTISNCAGTVIWSDCTYSAAQCPQVAFGRSLAISNCANVQLFGCTLRGRNAWHSGICTYQGTDGATVTGSTLTLNHCFLVGGNYADPLVCALGPIGGRALNAQNATIYAVGSAFLGGSQATLTQDLQLDYCTIWNMGSPFLFGSVTTYHNFSVPGPTLVGSSSINVITYSESLHSTSATVTSTGLTVTMTPAPTTGPAIFAFGQPRQSALPTVPTIGRLLLDTATPIDLLVAPGSPLVISLSAATLALLQHQTIAVTSARFGSSGELVLGTSDFVRF